jgi:hypothetical protein
VRHLWQAIRMAQKVGPLLGPGETLQ